MSPDSAQGAVVPPIPALPPRGFVPAPAPPLPKSPLAAVVLSFIFPGIGQVYNGQVQKAFAFFGGFVASLFSAITIDPMPFALFLPFVFFFGLVDAWRSATAINNRFLGGKGEPEDESLNSPAWGIVLVAAGSLLLLHNLELLDLARFQRFWPVLLILAGGYFIRQSIEARNKPEAGAPESGR